MNIAGCARCHWIGREEELAVKDGREFCPRCGCSDALTEPMNADRMTDDEQWRLLELLDDVPTDADNCIGEDFIGFPKGTGIKEILVWLGAA